MGINSNDDDGSMNCDAHATQSAQPPHKDQQQKGALILLTRMTAGRDHGLWGRGPRSFGTRLKHDTRKMLCKHLIRNVF